MADVPELDIAAFRTRDSRQRRPWVAAVLSFLIPGLGFQYSGFHRQAALLFLLFPAADLVMSMLILLVPSPPANVAIPVAFMLALRAFIASAAAAETRKRAAEARLGRLTRWYSLMGSVVLVGAIVNPLWSSTCRTTLVQGYRIPSEGMEDTILRGDYILAVKWTYGWRIPLLKGVVLGPRQAKRGDLVVFPFPEDPSRPFLKRIIGLPGETVEIRRKAVYIDGQPLEEPYARFLEPPDFDRDLWVLEGRPPRDPRVRPIVRAVDDWGPRNVPEDSYFVLGDNRDNSRDSRFWGYVEQGNLQGCPRVVYWSFDSVTDRVRWNRIGFRLD